MDQYDGSVIIKTALDTSGFTAGSKELADSAKQAAEKVQNIGVAARNSLDKQVDNFARMNDAYRQQTAEVEALQEKLEELQNTRVESEEYVALEKEIEKTGRELDKTADKIDKMIALYGQQKVAGMTSFQSVQYDMEQLQEKYDGLLAKQQEMAEDGLQYVPADTTAAQERLTAAQAKQEGMLVRLNDAYTRLRANIAKATEGATQGHKKMADEGVKAHKRLQKHSGISLKTIVKYAFGVRSVFMLYRRLRAAAKESLQELAKSDPELNNVVSRFLTAVKQLKYDIGTMIQPLVRVLAPVLTWFLNKLHEALIAISEFFAIITGQDYIEPATVENVNWAASMDAVTKSAKEATKALGGYDKLNIISHAGEGDGVGGIGAGEAQADAAKEGVHYTKIQIDKNKEWIKTLIGVREEAINVAEGYFEAYDEGGLKGVGGHFLETVGETMLELQKELPQGVQNALEATQETVEVYFEHGLVEGLAENAEYVRETAVDALADAMYDASTAKPEIKRRWTKTEQEIYDRLKDEERAKDEVYKNSLKYAKEQERYHNTISGYYERLKEEREALVENGKTILKGVDKAFKDKHGKSILDVGKQFVEANKGTTNKIKNTINNVKDGVASMFGEVARTIVPSLRVEDLVRDMSGKLKDGVTNTVELVKNSDLPTKAKGIGASIKNAIVNAFGFGKGDTDKMTGEVGNAGDTLTRTIGTTQTVKTKFANVGSIVAKIVAGGFKVEDLEKNKIANEIAGAVGDAGKGGDKTPIAKKAKELGRKVIENVVSNMAATDKDKGTVEGKLAGTMDGITADVNKSTSALGKSVLMVGKTISEHIKGAMEFTEQDGKDSASALAAGLNVVSSEAGRKGSTLYNALQGVGKKIMEGINNGTISVPSNVTGNKTPTGSVVEKAWEKMQSKVVVYLDGKVIAETVYDEAKKQQKQTGSAVSGARAVIEWAMG